MTWGSGKSDGLEYQDAEFTLDKDELSTAVQFDGQDVLMLARTGDTIEVTIYGGTHPNESAVLVSYININHEGD